MCPVDARKRPLLPYRHTTSIGLFALVPCLARSQLVRRDAVELIERIGAIPGLETLAMTTNALTLSRKIPQLVDAGLTHVNISLDTLLDFKFEIITRRRGFAKVMKGIEDSIAAGLRVKINCMFYLCCCPYA